MIVSFLRCGRVEHTACPVSEWREKPPGDLQKLLGLLSVRRMAALVDDVQRRTLQDFMVHVPAFEGDDAILPPPDDERGDPDEP